MKRRDRSEGVSNNSSDDETPASVCFTAVPVPLAGCLVREVKQMSTSHQEEASKDVLGISPAIEISPEMIAQVWEHIRDVEDTAAWDLALQMNREYTMSSERAMSFLRSVGGKPKQAAKRLARHFATKLELFGASKLVKDIEISTDFDEYDLEALESGGFQVLAEKDRAGRPILFGRYTLMRYKEVKNMVRFFRSSLSSYANAVCEMKSCLTLTGRLLQVRVLWYMWNSMVEEEDHQISGVVAIGFENGKLPLERFGNEESSVFELHTVDGGFDRELAREILKMPLSVPVRPMGYHICADNSRWQSIFDMVMVTICKFVRVRLRFHYGTQQETMYAMMTHGIPVNAIPIKDSGDVDLSHHQAWIEKRRQLEEQRRRDSQLPGKMEP